MQDWLGNPAILAVVALSLIVLPVICIFAFRSKPVTETYDTGEIRRVYTTRRGKKVGKERVSYRSGKLNRTKHYRRGQLQGTATTFYESGQKYLETEYRSGSVVARRVFEEGGHLKEIPTPG